MLNMGVNAKTTMIGRLLLDCFITSLKVLAAPVLLWLFCLLNAASSTRTNVDKR